MQLRRFNAAGNAHPGVDLPDCAAHYNHMAFIFPGAAATMILWWAVDLLFGPYVRKWVMARSTEVWPRGIRPHDLDGVFGHYRLSRSRLECRKLGETVSNCEQT